MQQRREKLKESRKNSPRNSELLNDLGTVYLMQEKWFDAIPSLKRATELKANYPATLHNLGFAYIKTEQKVLAQQVPVQLKLLRPDYLVKITLSSLLKQSLAIHFVCFGIR